MNVVKVSENTELPSFIANNIKEDEKFCIDALVPVKRICETQDTKSTNVPQPQNDIPTAHIALAAGIFYIPEINVENRPSQGEPSLDLNCDSLPTNLVLDIPETSDHFPVPSLLQNIPDSKHTIKMVEDDKTNSTTDENHPNAISLTPNHTPTHSYKFEPTSNNNFSFTPEDKTLNMQKNLHYAEEVPSTNLNIPQELLPNMQEDESDIQLTPTQQQLKTLDTEVATNATTISTVENSDIHLPQKLKEVIDKNASELSESKFQVKVIPKQEEENISLDNKREVPTIESTQPMKKSEPHKEVTQLKTDGKTTNTQTLSSEDDKVEAIEKSQEEIQDQTSLSNGAQELSDGTKTENFNTEVLNSKAFPSTNQTNEKADEVAQVVTSQTIEGISHYFQTNTSSKSLQIQLDPVNLGKVDIQISTLEDGSIHAKFVVENKETLQILARDSLQIEQALKDNMLDNRNVQIDFATAQDGHYNGQQSQEKFDAHQANQMARAKEGYGAHPTENIREYVRHTTLGYNIKA